MQASYTVATDLIHVSLSQMQTFLMEQLQ